MTVRHKGIRKARYGSSSAFGWPQTYDYHSPGITLECEKYLNQPELLAKLSSEVRVIRAASIPPKEE